METADGILVVYSAPSYQMQDVRIENNILDDLCTQNCSSHRHVQVTNTGMSGFVLIDNLYWPQSIANAVDAASSPTGPTMAWDPGSTSNLAGYNVYRSSQLRGFNLRPA